MKTKEFTLDGVTFALTTDHAASSYGVPVLVDAAGNAFGTMDVVPGLALSAAEIAIKAYRRGMISREECLAFVPATL